MTDTNPEHVLDDKDPGDDVFRRYRYQATYAAIVALGMLRKQTNLSEVFAEHHNDILVKLKTNRFHAVQVKTQQPGGTPFKSNDDEIKRSLAKFISHERDFGSAFERYTIATNHQFFKADSGTSLFFLVDKARAAKSAAPSDMDSRLSGFINSFLKAYNKGRDRDDRATRDDVLTVLQKLQLDHNLPKLDNIHQQLRDSIATSNPEYRDATYADLERAADALAFMAYSKSSLLRDDSSQLYLSYAIDPANTERDDVINGKRITKNTVTDLLAREIASRPTLNASEPVDPSTLPADLSTAEKKMTAGGLSATTVAASRDWQASTEHLQRQWAMKYQERTAIDRYNHVAVAVQTACAEAHESTRDAAPQGPSMMDALRTVLRRKRQEGTSFFDCEEEHLLGHAVIRTGQCKVWWSAEFGIE